MATSLWWAGFNVKANVNSVALAIKRLSVRATVGDLDVTNTEGQTGNVAAAAAVGFAARIAGVADAEIRLEQPTFDSASNPFIAPFSLVLGGYVNLRFFKNTRTGVSWVCASGLVCEIDDDADVKGLQVPSFTIRSDGLFTLPVV